MSKAVTALVACVIATPAFADWRMERFDINRDSLISVNELKASGCVVKKHLFDHADKNRDSFLDRKEAKKASEYVMKSKCPKVK
jgi:hypothetical protein